MPHSVNTQCPLILYFAVERVLHMVSALEEVESLLVLMLVLLPVLLPVLLLLQPVSLLLLLCRSICFCFCSM